MTKEIIRKINNILKNRGIKIVNLSSIDKNFVEDDLGKHHVYTAEVEIVFDDDPDECEEIAVLEWWWNPNSKCIEFVIEDDDGGEIRDFTIQDNDLIELLVKLEALEK